MHMSPTLSTERPFTPAAATYLLSTVWLSFRICFVVYPELVERVRVGRIELPLTDWQPVVMPLDHTRIPKNYIIIFAACAPGGIGHRFLPRRQAPRPRLMATLWHIPAFESLTKANQLAFSFAVLPEGFEPPTTASKAVMISISPQEQS